MGLAPEVLARWRRESAVPLMPARSLEREAVRGTALTAGRVPRGRRSQFVTERMTLIVDIDWLLCSRMDAAEIRQWVRRRVAGVLGTSPLDDLVGSTDRLRRIRTLLQLEAPQ